MNAVENICMSGCLERSSEWQNLTKLQQWRSSRMAVKMLQLFVFFTLLHELYYHWLETFFATRHSRVTPVAWSWYEVHKLKALQSCLRNVVKIRKYKSLVWIETACNDVFRVFKRKPFAFIDGQIFPQELFIVSQLNDHRNIECVL